MSDSARDPAMQAVARLEAAVERLAQALEANLQSRARPDSPEFDPMDTDAPDLVPRAEVAALAERLEATIARLRAALPEEVRSEVRSELRPEGRPETRFGES